MIDEWGMKEPNNDPVRKKWLDTRKIRRLIRASWYISADEEIVVYPNGVPELRTWWGDFRLYHPPHYRPRHWFKHFGNGKDTVSGNPKNDRKSSRRMMRLKEQWRLEALERDAHD